MSEIDLRLGDCLEILPTLPDNSVDAVITDPPYGCGKADWDDNFPSSWYTEARRIGRLVAIITGSQGLADSIPLVGDDFIDVVAAWNTNGMTRSAIGFGNWIAAVIAVGKPRQGQSVIRFVTKDKVKGHPTIKQIEYMSKLIIRLSDEGDTILDPFMGSGTTGVACVQTGRNFIGIEIEEKYYEIAEKRIAAAQLQLRMPL